MRWLLSVALSLFAGIVHAQNGQDDPLALSVTTSACDARASILNIARPVSRSFDVMPNDAGVIALLDLGGPEATRYHILIADRFGTDPQMVEPGHCYIVAVNEPTLALTGKFQVGRSSNAGGTLDARRPGPAARLSLDLLRTDMTEGRYVSDAVAYIHLDHETGDVLFELWSISDPRRRD